VDIPRIYLLQFVDGRRMAMVDQSNVVVIRNFDRRRRIMMMNENGVGGCLCICRVAIKALIFLCLGLYCSALRLFNLYGVVCSLDLLRFCHRRAPSFISRVFTRIIYYISYQPSPAPTHQPLPSFPCSFAFALSLPLT
jgi:hypothetical protein